MHKYSYFRGCSLFNKFQILSVWQTKNILRSYSQSFICSIEKPIKIENVNIFPKISFQIKSWWWKLRAIEQKSALHENGFSSTKLSYISFMKHFRYRDKKFRSVPIISIIGVLNYRDRTLYFKTTNSYVLISLATMESVSLYTNSFTSDGWILNRHQVVYSRFMKLFWLLYALYTVQKYPYKILLLPLTLDAGG